MSDTFLRLIPACPECVPDDEALRAASHLLASFFPEADEAAFESTERVNFVDPGQNLGRIACPVCGGEIDTAWWQKAMDAAYQTHFSDLSIELPCCKTSSSLNDLLYDWPAGFAKFELTVRNPRARGRVEDAQLEQLETVLGCTLRVIWALY
jgi:hypothetical protein